MSTIFYALCQKSESSGKIYYRDFNNCIWKESIDENCLSSKKQFVEELGENSWKGNYKIISFDLTIRRVDSCKDDQQVNCYESNPGIVVFEDQDVSLFKWLKSWSREGNEATVSKKEDFKKCMKCTDCTYQYAFKDGYSRANKWHFVKDGDLPEENQEVLIFFPLPDKSRNVVAISQFKDNDFDVADLEDVIAWKEITVPQEE